MGLSLDFAGEGGESDNKVVSIDGSVLACGGVDWRRSRLERLVVFGRSRVSFQD